MLKLSVYGCLQKFERHRHVPLEHLEGTNLNPTARPGSEPHKKTANPKAKSHIPWHKQASLSLGSQGRVLGTKVLFEP